MSATEEEIALITIDQLKKIIPYAGQRAGVFLMPLNDAMTEFGIDTPQRQSAFLAQVAHESGSLRYVREIADGSAYEGRADLGNTELGDGARFKGRGLIQITGRANYRSCSKALYGADEILQLHPKLLEDVVPACRSAAWFWWSHGLNSIADAGDYRKITRVINGGFNGYNERLFYYQRAQTVLA